MHRSWGVVIEAGSAGVVQVVEEVGEESGSFGLVVVGGVVALADEDGHELGAGLEEATAFADRFVDAVEGCGPVAVSVAEQAAMVGEDGFSRVDCQFCATDFPIALADVERPNSS